MQVLSLHKAQSYGFWNALCVHRDPWRGSDCCCEHNLPSAGTVAVCTLCLLPGLWLRAHFAYCQDCVHTLPTARTVAVHTLPTARTVAVHTLPTAPL